MESMDVWFGKILSFSKSSFFKDVLLEAALEQWEQPKTQERIEVFWKVIVQWNLDKSWWKVAAIFGVVFALLDDNTKNKVSHFCAFVQNGCVVWAVKASRYR